MALNHFTLWPRRGGGFSRARIRRFAAASSIVFGALAGSLNPGVPIARAQIDGQVDRALGQAAVTPDRTSIYAAWNALIARDARSVWSLVHEAEVGTARIEELAARLEAGEAIVRLTAYEDAPTSARRHLALVQRRNSAPILLKLQGDLEGALGRWTQLVAQDPRDHPEGPLRAEEMFAQLADQLRSEVWDPIATLFESPGVVLLVTDPELRALDPDALRTYDGSLLIESAWRFHRLSNETDLLFTRNLEDPLGRGVCALSRPDFDATDVFGAGLPGASPQPHTTTNPSAARRPACLEAAIGDTPMRAPWGTSLVDLCLERWNRPSPFWKFWSGGNPADRGEVVALRDSGASEARWKSQAPTRRVLLLGSRAVDARGREFCEADDAIDLVGLALAGAHHFRAAEPGDEDALLLASEVRALPLAGIDWVVLPELGRDLENAAPLSGAFLRAGCRSVIYSRWMLESDWIGFALGPAFDARVHARASTQEAMRLGRLAALERARKNRGSSHPYYWTALRADGNWR